MRGIISVLGAALLVATGWVAIAANPQAPAVKVDDKPAASAVSPEQSKAEEPIRAVIQAFLAAYNAEKTVDLVALFDDDATVVDSDGVETKGKEAISAMFAQAFEDVDAIKLESEIATIKFLTPDVARVDGRSKLSTGKAGGVEHSRYSMLLIRRGGAWKAADLRDYTLPRADILPAERLAELEWMVGDWVDESDNSRVSSNIRWSEGKSFLIRTYHVELDGIKATSGTMFIGWSPQVGQIKSWLFDSEGSHGEGLWTRVEGNTWVVKAHGVLRDGRPTSATQIHVMVNKDAVKTSSIDRIVGGVVAPDINDILMVRKAPAPAPSVKGAPPGSK